MNRSSVQFQVVSDDQVALLQVLDTPETRTLVKQFQVFETIAWSQVFQVFPTQSLEKAYAQVQFAYAPNPVILHQ